MPVAAARRNFFLWSAVTVLLTLLSIWSYALVGWREHRQLTKEWAAQEVEEGRKVLTAFGDHTSRLIELADSHLRAVRQFYIDRGGGQALRDYLAVISPLHSENVFGSLFIVDRNGKVVFHSEYDVPSGTNMSDLEYFVRLRDAGRDMMFLDPTRTGRTTNRSEFRIVRPIITGAGFQGVVVQTLQPFDMLNFFNLFNDWLKSAFFIKTTDKHLIAHFPFTESDGDGADDSVLWSMLKNSPEGSYSEVSPEDGVGRFYLYRELEDYPLVIGVGISEADLVGGAVAARRRLNYQIVGFALSALAVCCLVMVILRKNKDLVVAEEAAKEAALALEQSNRLLERQASTDGLTGLANRRRLMELGEQETRRAMRFGHPLAVIMVDIDHFKAVNDAFGHATGDRVIQAVAGATLASVRQVDMVGRIGGEEFVILLPETGLAQAKTVAERQRQSVEQLAVRAEDGRVVRFTNSLGVAELRMADENFEQVLARADRALYQAKNAGRNRVEAVAEDVIPSAPWI